MHCLNQMAHPQETLTILERLSWDCNVVIWKQLNRLF